jgi:hypothetical protein
MGNALSMETLKDFLWPIAAVGGFSGLGTFIDFLIGKTGQERAKDFLLRWWVRFDDVGWRNFGREEGIVCRASHRKMVWKTSMELAGWQRIVSGIVLYMGFIVIGN